MPALNRFIESSVGQASSGQADNLRSLSNVPVFKLISKMQRNPVVHSLKSQQLIPWQGNCLWRSGLLLTLALVWVPTLRATAQSDPACPAPVLSRLDRHQVTAGETLESIAQRYNLIPATLMGFNPAVRGGQVRPGMELVIPPYNGIQVTAKPGQTWSDLANIYGIRADVLFEANGCTPKPGVAFVPGVNWSPSDPTAQQRPGAADRQLLSSYPLPQTASTLLAYGWQLHPDLEKVAFHSGLDLAASPGTSVLAMGDGVVAFAGSQGEYGSLVVLNHARGLQTRYAHLNSIRVSTGQQVRQGTLLGTVGQTGRPTSRSPHLHIEVRRNSRLGWIAEDPAWYIAP